MNYVLLMVGWMIVSLFLIFFIIQFDRKKFASVGNGFLYLALSFILGVAFLLACLKQFGM
ncbi:MAG TPA: hypothetical protein VI757_10570 [Bacteroidia bacterium]|nr:hypothetical protein [Bacteroidia bacterium]